MAERGPESGTSTVLGARDHARAQAASAAAEAIVTRPTVPAHEATDLPAGVVPRQVVWDETLGDGGYASRVVRRGVHLRLTDVAGHANVSLMLHHAARPLERLNVADTVKLQWNAYPGAGSLLLSDMGRVLGTVLPDSTGAIDPLCGASPASGRTRLLLGLAKHGLTRRDLPPAVNVFTTARVEADGGLRLDALSAPGDHITLRAELDLLVTLAVVPHPLDDPASATGATDRPEGAPPGVPSGPSGPAPQAPRAGMPERPGSRPGDVTDSRALLVRITAWQGQPAGPDDPARQVSPEARRAFENTDDVLTALPGPAGPAS